jgi:hypothetical protein
MTGSTPLLQAVHGSLPAIRGIPVCLLLASGLLLPAAAGAVADRTALLADAGRTRTEIESYENDSFASDGKPEAASAIGRLWGLAQTWTSEYLDAHPHASAYEIKADLAPLAKAGDLEASAVRLGSDAVVVALDRGFQGTVFIVSRTPPQPFAVTWDIRGQAVGSWLDADMIPWIDTVPGVHAGPLGGRVLALPPHRSGRPRFLIDALQHSGMGLEVPGQISVWEWTGSTAMPELIQNYVTTGGPSARRVGDRLRVRTKEITQRIYTCGSCDAPLGTWTLRVTPDGLVDLGHAFDQPLLKLVDDLLDRMIRHQDASALASPSARKQLAEILAEEQAEDGKRDPKPKEDDLLLGMIMDWKVRARAGHRVIDLATDRVHLLFTVGRRSGKPYVTAVKDLQPDSEE